jgi:copper(I)-binding protein
VTEGRWVKQESEKPTDTASLWKFTDERGRQWNASASLQTLIGEKNRFLFSLKIARADRKQMAAASPVDPNKITVRDAWIQEGPPSQKLTAAFMVIENQGVLETELVSARTDIANVVELHKMETVDEVMRMSKVDLISVPGEGRAELSPSGFHLMLIGLNKEIKQGDEVTVTLQFANSVQKTIRVPVRKREAMGNRRHNDDK